MSVMVFLHGLEQRDGQQHKMNTPLTNIILQIPVEGPILASVIPKS